MKILSSFWNCVISRGHQVWIGIWVRVHVGLGQRLGLGLGLGLVLLTLGVVKAGMATSGNGDPGILPPDVRRYRRQAVKRH